MNTSQAHPGSFRDPSGQLYQLDNRIFRTVTDGGASDFEFVRSTGLIDGLVADRVALPAELVNPQVLGRTAKRARYVLEHPKLPFISYPYEWCFSALKAAALLDLDIHLRALDRGVTLADASAYNIQFRGTRPIFIDYLSFRRYHDGEIWVGHRQFCEQYLNPLLLRAFLGVPHNAWYRGTQEGISAIELNRLLPLRRKLSWNVFTQVVLQAHFQKMALRDGRVASAKDLRNARLPLPAFRRMLRRLRAWIAGLNPADTGKTTWSDYAADNTYNEEEANKKKTSVAEFTARWKPSLIWDLGCNTGDYAKTALEAGATYAVGFDLDQGAVEAAFQRAQTENLDLLPLVLDIANPSPSQGWAENERQGLRDRGPADAILALALVHHLAIGRNVPLDQVVTCLVGLAPAGIVEFVPKADPMVQRLLELREDIFSDYNEENFLASLQRQARIIKAETVSQSGRKLVWFYRS